MGATLLLAHLELFWEGALEVFCGNLGYTSLDLGCVFVPSLSRWSRTACTISCSGLCVGQSTAVSLLSVLSASLNKSKHFHHVLLLEKVVSWLLRLLIELFQTAGGSAWNPDEAAWCRPRSCWTSSGLSMKKLWENSHQIFMFSSPYTSWLFPQFP